MLVPPLKSFLNNFQIRESHAGYYAGLGKSLVRALQGWSTPQGLKQNIIQKKEQKYRHFSEGRTEKQTLFKRRNRKIDILQKKEQKHRHYSVGRTERQTFFRKKKRKANIVKKEEQKDRHY